jgi:putative sigma-54 modulation protein
MKDKKAELQVVVTGRHIDITDAMKKHAEEKVSKLPRYYDGINFIEVIIDASDKVNKSVEVIARAEHNKVFVATDTGDDLYTCIDMAVHKIERQITKSKTKERDNKHIASEQE